MKETDERKNLTTWRAVDAIMTNLQLVYVGVSYGRTKLHSPRKRRAEIKNRLYFICTSILITSGKQFATRIISVTVVIPYDLSISQI